MEFATNMRMIALSAAIGLGLAAQATTAKAAGTETLLVAGGYALERVTPVDQFRYSAHIELVGVFRKAAGRK